MLFSQVLVPSAEHRVCGNAKCGKVRNVSMGVIGESAAAGMPWDGRMFAVAAVAGLRHDDFVQAAKLRVHVALHAEVHLAAHLPSATNAIFGHTDTRGTPGTKRNANDLLGARTLAQCMRAACVQASNMWQRWQFRTL